MPRAVSDEKNPRGIPKAPFIVRVSAFVHNFAFDLRSQTDVEGYLGEADADVEATLKSFQDA